jgi:hypothetical protein
MIFIFYICISIHSKLDEPFSILVFIKPYVIARIKMIFADVFGVLIILF